jgi:hypothetical protein
MLKPNELVECPTCRNKIEYGSFVYSQYINKEICCMCQDNMSNYLNDGGNQQSYVSRDMAMDAGDLSLEGWEV